MKKLPKIYKNEDINTIDNNKKVCKVEEINSFNNVSDTLKYIRTGLGEEYNTEVIIETINNTYDTSLITKTKDYVITKDNELINIKDIKNIIIKK